MAIVPNVGEAMRRHAARATPGGPTVKVRALTTVFYGYPLASSRPRGAEFQFRIADLKLAKDLIDPTTKKPWAAGKKATYYTGVPVRYIERGGTKYALPSSVEDASLPSSIADPDQEESEFDDIDAVGASGAEPAAEEM